MNRTMRSFYTTMGIVLILLFVWVGSYLALRHWGDEGVGWSNGGTSVQLIQIHPNFYHFRICYQPLRKIDSHLTRKIVYFVNPDEVSGRFNTSIQFQF